MIKIEKNTDLDLQEEIRLIGLDLDGTTLTSDKVLTAHTKKVIEKAIKKGIHVLPATGRTKVNIPEYLKGIEGMRYILGSNGAFILDRNRDEMIYVNGIAKEDALALLRKIEDYHTFYDIYIDGEMYCEARFYDNLDAYDIPDAIRDLILRSVRLEDMDLCSLVEKIGKPVEKIYMLFNDQELKKTVMEDLEKDGRVKASYSLPQNLEINASSCSKGNAILFLGDYLGISPEQIMACGDGNNDLDMIRAVGQSVAMENAVEEVKNVAKYETRTNDQEGVAFAIEALCGIE